MIEAQPMADPMLVALLAGTPKQLAEDVQSVRGLFIVSGRQPRQAQRKVAELYIPPRVARELASPRTRRACTCLAAGTTFEFVADGQGRPLNFVLAGDWRRC